MLCIKNECVVTSELQECSNTCITKKLKMDAAKFNKEVKETFNYDGDNVIMKSQSMVLQNSGV